MCSQKAGKHKNIGEDSVQEEASGGADIKVDEGRSENTMDVPPSTCVPNAKLYKGVP